MGFSVPGEGKIDDSVLTSKRVGEFKILWSLLTVLFTQTVIQRPLIQMNPMRKISGEVFIEKNLGRGLCLVKFPYSPGKL